MLGSHEIQCRELLETCQSVLSNREGFKRWHGGNHNYGDIHEGGPRKDTACPKYLGLRSPSHSTIRRTKYDHKLHWKDIFRCLMTSWLGEII